MDHKSLHLGEPVQERGKTQIGSLIDMNGDHLAEIMTEKKTGIGTYLEIQDTKGPRGEESVIVKVFKTLAKFKTYHFLIFKINFT